MGFEQKFNEYLVQNYTARGTQIELSRKSGVTQGTLSKMINKAKQIDIDQDSNSKKKEPKNVLSNISSIIDAMGEPFLNYLVSEENPHTIPTEISYINVYSTAGAGSAIEICDTEPLFKIYLSSRMARKVDMALEVVGHSMEPLIPHGSIIGVKKDTPFVADEIYVAYIPYEGYVVKRVGFDRSTSEFIFKSENPNKENYPDFRLSINDSEKILIGSVVWIFREP